MASIPHGLRGRGHNECVPIECQCGCMFLRPLSDGTKTKSSKPDDTILARCPACKTVEQFKLGDLTIHNGQAGKP